MHLIKDVRSATLYAMFLCCLIVASDATAQLSQKDIDALRKRGQEEGWTFDVALNGATQYSLKQLCGTVVPPDYEPTYSSHQSRMAAPSSWDWRDVDGVNYCTPIRSQGGCGSCWAFSALGTLESQLRIHWGIYVDLSEQWLVSCTNSGDCEGGWFDQAFNYMKCENAQVDYCFGSGAVLEEDCPYEADDITCGCPYLHPYCLADWSNVPNGVLPLKQAIMEHGPISVTVCVDDAFHAYNGGIFNACSGTELNHAVVLVGWDDSLGTEGVWIMRNSWNTWWGDEGYMYIEYGCSCIGTNAAYVDYGSTDCNLNGIADTVDIEGGLSEDCNFNDLPDECESDADCNENFITDICELADGSQLDCNENGTLDVCDLSTGDSFDCNGNGIPDECDVADGTSWDCDQNGVLDDCEGSISGVNPLRIRAGATGAGTGESWENAIPNLYEALCTAEHDPAVTELWVAEGTYLPTQPGGARSATFQLASGVSILGGFAGWETDRNERQWESNYTILSGDLNSDDEPWFTSYSDNSYHVVTGSGSDSSAVLDGFIVLGGNANGDNPDNRGGGMLNIGGSPTIVNCAFLRNSAAWAGGAVSSLQSSNPTFIGCVFSGNRSKFFGGAICTEGAGAIVQNCTISMNNATDFGGGLYIDYASTTPITNSIVWGNTDGGGLDLRAQIHGDRSLVTYSCVQEWPSFMYGNTPSEPLFVDADGPDDIPGTGDDNLRLASLSPCVNGGVNYLSGLPSLDIQGEPRVQNCGVDMGAYETSLAPDSWDDCNDNSQDDACDIENGTSLDHNYNDVPDECETITLGDFDANGYINVTDFKALSYCMAGPETQPNAESSEHRLACIAAFDYDEDGDIDLIDYADWSSNVGQ